jgi:hypothetical protein
MILFPHDDVKAWCGAYPPEVVAGQFAKMATVWRQGLSVLRRAATKVPPRATAAAEAELAIAETCYHHFQSTANQVEFYALRERLAAAGGAERARILKQMRRIARAEIEIARRQFLVARRHSAIAFEASNHYYYTPLDLAEKILNCRQVLESLPG